MVRLFVVCSRIQQLVYRSVVAYGLCLSACIGLIMKIAGLALPSQDVLRLAQVAWLHNSSTAATVPGAWTLAD